MTVGDYLPLDGMRVVELAGDRGQLCGRLLADLGADVVKVEPPVGSEARRRPPFAPTSSPTEASLSFAWFNANKRGVVLDVDDEVDRRRLRELILGADVLVDDAQPGTLAAIGLDPDALQQANPGLVYCSITGFGLDGLYANYLAPDVVAFAMSGLMYISGEPELPPLAPPYDQAYQIASVTAAYGVVAALRSRLRTGSGQRVEVSAQEVLAGVQHVVANYAANSDILRRTGTRSPVGGLASPQGAYRCLDGYVYLSIIWTPHWKALVDWMGRPEELDDPIFETRQVRCDSREFLDTFVEAFLANQTKDELFREGQRRRTFIAPINTPSEFTRDRQIEARGFFKEVKHPALGSLRMPGMPYQLGDAPLPYRRPAPRLGEHTEEVLRSARSAPSSSPGSSHQIGFKRLDGSARPLAGVRVVDFTHAVAGPTLTRLLAEFGAEVIKVESRKHYQRGRVQSDERRAYRQQAATFTDLNRNKLSLALNMDSEEGRAVARRVIAGSDVVINNFSPRVMRRWGLDYEQLCQLRPDIVGVDMPGYGLDGPHQEFLAGAVIVQGLSGAFHLWDYQQERPPAAPPSWYADYGAGVMAAVAITAALYQRDLTGRGQHIEQSQLEATATFLAPAYLDYFANGVDEEPFGTHSSEHAPYGPYQCRGEDRWCVIAVENDEQWVRLVEAMDSPRWATAAELTTEAGRLAAGDELNRRITAWTRELTPHQVMRRLQALGVPAGVVMDAEDLYLDPHLRERGFFHWVDHPATGPVEYPGPPLRLSGTPGEVGDVSSFGQHTDYVLRKVAGYSAAEIEQLRADGVLG